MKFLKGAMLGALIGSTAVMMKDGMFNSILKKGKKEFKKLKRMCMV